eukprot:CAMPEP_0175960242 /NCGR_PEP_ID=MMETSP0108-20121206/35254_1 /TAXON_ID=195067 ORGANISM="Goniomonas pacifica, Strain CCMP1869" /NCGR_SAMPLE_ID=MMETSP0108 /ASSEMBLY_ACC=CAM_ASM_000204 /LENGTH=248 /DNA_ID=CAMNT_0017287805 /DNA_START=11 /DNA_END=757 /DNA_ORIENTATION=-
MRYFREYDFTTTWPVMISAVLLYLAGVFLLKRVMTARESAFSLKRVLLVYNSFQVMYCLHMAVGLTRGNFDLFNPFGMNTSLMASHEWFILLHYFSKYLDFADTAFMLLKKNFRQLTFLHVYHHASILIVWGWLLQNNQAGGTVYFGALINSWVHVLMYAHYLFTSLGFQNPLKPYLTMIQIGQMWLCLLHALLVCYFENVIEANNAKVQAAYHVIMIVLFTNFYMKSYGNKKNVASEKKEAVAAKAE